MEDKIKLELTYKEVQTLYRAFVDSIDNNSPHTPLESKLFKAKEESEKQKLT